MITCWNSKLLKMIQTGIVYLIVLWDFFLSRVQMYRATQYTKGLNNAIRFGWIAIIVIFVVEFVYDLVRGFFAAGILRLIVLAVYTAVLAIGTLIVVILFLSYGQKMYCRLKIFNSKFGDTKKEKKMRKVQFTLHLFVCFFVIDSMKKTQFQFHFWSLDQLVCEICEYYHNYFDLWIDHIVECVFYCRRECYFGSYFVHIRTFFWIQLLSCNRHSSLEKSEIHEYKEERYSVCIRECWINNCNEFFNSTEPKCSKHTNAPKQQQYNNRNWWRINWKRQVETTLVEKICLSLAKLKDNSNKWM